MKFKEFKVGDNVIAKIGEEHKRYTISNIRSYRTFDSGTQIILVSGNTILAEGESEQETNDICLVPDVMVGSIVSFKGDKYGVIKIYNKDDNRLYDLRNMLIYDKATVMLKDAGNIGKWDYDNTALSEINTGEYVHVTDPTGHTMYGFVYEKQTYVAGDGYKTYEVSIRTGLLANNDVSIKLKGYGSCGCVDMNGYKIRKLPKVYDTVLYHGDLFTVANVGPVCREGEYCIGIKRQSYGEHGFTTALVGIRLHANSYEHIDTNPYAVYAKQMEMIGSYFKEHCLGIMEKNKSFHVCDPFTSLKTVLKATEGDYVIADGFEDGDNKPGRFVAKVKKINTIINTRMNAIEAFDHLYTIDELMTVYGVSLMRIPNDIRMGYKIYYCGHPGFISTEPVIKDGKVSFSVHVYYKTGRDDYFESERDIDIDNIRQINFVPEIEDRDKKNNRPMPDKITIVSDGVKKVQAISGMVEGTANCHPDNKFDIFAGARIALDRLEKRFKD